MVLVSVNMPRFGFSPCKKKLLFLVPVKYFVFENTIFKSKTFCRDLFKNQKILQGLFF